MDIKLLNTVILASDYRSLVDWYRKTFELETKIEVSDEYHFTELHKNGNFVIAIGDAVEMGVKPQEPRNNCVIAQLAVSDISVLFDNVRANNGKVLFGPSYDEKWKFFYGGFNDIEGNQLWVIEEKK